MDSFLTAACTYSFIFAICLFSSSFFFSCLNPQTNILFYPLLFSLCGLCPWPWLKSSIHE
ncbi:hypothetical protein BC939DRAFT_455193 [Gamsiella multidivaricata]|uniref:uncharacterized protein n=1 Tax=Gamsiella multidivaricata TaxID=101098 RepID=UPI00221F9A91|nr:uncharacterized protein BC939DRAFT_455193 [Gamsiella multidivaricata]KAI7821718.1 hypothetical protein BC939DRAFT_455193 [Gamsiella multidivaricata]